MQELFDTTTKPLLSLLKSGSNSVLLSYGHRCTGKRTTLFFHPEKSLFQTIIENLLEFAEEQEKTKEVTVSLSVLELFEDNLHDLAYGVKNPTGFESFEKSLEVKEHLGKVSIPSATTIDAFSLIDAGKIVDLSMEFRSNYEKKTKEYEERASTFVIIYLKQRTKGSTWNQVSTSTMVIGLLAAAERPKIRNGKEFYEFPAVHKSFNALSKVLGNIKSPKVPWRDHVLTKVMKIGMSDSPKIVILAHINPAKQATQDSIHSLNFMEKCKPNQSSNFTEKMTEEEIDIQIQKLQEEKAELKAKLQKIESSQEGQIKKLCELMGIEEDLEGIINETNEKELEIIQTRKESYAKIEKGVKKNQELERKYEESQALLDRVKKAEFANQENHLKKMIDLKDHLQRLKDELLTIQFNSKYYENEKVEAKSQELVKMIENSKNLIQEKEKIMENLPTTLNPLNKPINPEELKSQGKKEVTENYRKRFEDQAKRHKEEIKIAETKKIQSIQEKKQVLSNMIENFKKTRNEKKSKIKSLSRELVDLYEILKNSRKVLESVQKGKFSKGKEVFVPPDRVPVMPEPEDFVELFKLVNGEEKTSVHPIMQLKSLSLKQSKDENDVLVDVAKLEESEIAELIVRLNASCTKLTGEIRENEEKGLALKSKMNEVQTNFLNVKGDRDLYREMFSKEQKSITESKFLIENQRKILENIGGIPIKSPKRPFSQGISRSKK